MDEHIIAIDPGKVTGAAHWPLMKTHSFDRIEELFYWVRWKLPEVLIVEDYVDFQKWSNVHSRWPLEVIGAMRVIQCEKFVLQKPYERKIIKADTIEESTEFRPKNIHERDAVRHLLAYQLRRRLKKDA